MVLTDAGRIFFSKVENLLDHWTNLNSEVSREVNRELWRINIGCHPSVAKYTLPKILPSLMLEFPKLSIKLEHDLSRKINERIIESKIDLGLVINPISQPELIIRPLTEDTVTLWECENNPNRGTLIYDPSLAQSQWILRKLKKRGEFDRFIESDNLEVIRDLSLSGAGVGILPQRFLRKLLPENFWMEDFS